MSVWRNSLLPRASRFSPRRDPNWRRSARGIRRVLIGSLLAALCAGAAFSAIDLASGGSRHTAGTARAAATAARRGAPALDGGPARPGTARAPGGAAGSGGNAISQAVAARTVAEVRDPEESKSFPVSRNALAGRQAATTPARAAQAFVAPGALSTAQIRHELGRIQALERAQGAAGAASPEATTVPLNDSVGGNGTIPIPPNVPAVIQKVIAGANEIADYPYVYGGGHASFQDNAYDCSGSVSYALAAGGLLSAPETSGQLESWGAPGPGRWLTIYANEGHVYMYVNTGAGWMRYDTVGRSGPYASRWQPYVRSNEGFVARHWPGL